MENDQKRVKAKYDKMSSKGRIIKKPQKIVTTSSDETPKRTKKSINKCYMQAEIERLRSMMNNIQENSELPKKTDTCPKIEPLDAKKASETTENAAMKYLKERNLVTEISSPSVHPVNDSESDDISVNNSNNTQSLIIEKTQVACTCQEIHTELLEKFKTLENSLIDGQQNIKDMVTKLLQSNGLNDSEAIVMNTFYKKLEGFPLQTVEQFVELESDEKKNERKKIYNHLRGLGGTKLREFLHSAFRETMSDALVAKFSWPGDSRTKQLKNTKLMNIIYLAARKCPLFNGPQDKATCKIEVQEVLRVIKQRHRKQLKKNVQKSPQSEESDLDEFFDEIEATDYETE